VSYSKTQLFGEVVGICFPQKLDVSFSVCTSCSGSNPVSGSIFFNGLYWRRRSASEIVFIRDRRRPYVQQNSDLCHAPTADVFRQIHSNLGG